MKKETKSTVVGSAVLFVSLFSGSTAVSAASVSAIGDSQNG